MLFIEGKAEDTRSPALIRLRRIVKGSPAKFCGEFAAKYCSFTLDALNLRHPHFYNVRIAKAHQHRNMMAEVVSIVFRYVKTVLFLIPQKGYALNFFAFFALRQN